MKVTLNIENDAELRLHIKDAIKGQVVSIIREEFSEMVTAELARILGTITKRDFDYQISKAMESVVNDVLTKQHDVQNWNPTFIKPFVDARLNEAIGRTDWNKLVDTLAKEKVRSLIS